MGESAASFGKSDMGKQSASGSFIKGEKIMYLKSIHHYLKTIFVAGALLMLTGCGYKIPLLKDKKSAYLLKKDMQIMAYSTRLNYPKIYGYDDMVSIFLYRSKHSYRGFTISLDENSIDSSFADDDLLDKEDRIPAKYYDVYYTNKKNWPTYWVLINDPRYPKIYFKWEPTSIRHVNGKKYDKGKLEVMLLPKGASKISKKRFAYYVSHIPKTSKKNNISQGVSLFNPFGGSFSLSQALNTVFPDDKNKGIQIKYQGYNKSNGTYIYDLKYNGSYNGRIVYYPNNGGYTIMSVGIEHGQSVNGYFSDGRLYTPQCGHTNADNINDAIKKAVNCIYKQTY